MDFVAIDVETANRRRSSICQIGLAFYEGGKLSGEWETYVNPREIFEWFNTKLHGIDQIIVKDAPDISKISGKLYKYLDNRIVVCHTNFDQAAISQAFAKYQLRTPGCTWMDSCRVARRTWEKVAVGSYGLNSLCTYLGYNFRHHDALEDAKAAGHIVVCAMQQTGLNVQELLQYCRI